MSKCASLRSFTKYADGLVFIVQLKLDLIGLELDGSR